MEKGIPERLGQKLFLVNNNFFGKRSLPIEEKKSFQRKKIKVLFLCFFSRTKN